MVPSARHAPPKKSAISPIGCVRPLASEYFRSSPFLPDCDDTPTAKATHSPSGEKNGPSASSLFGTIVGGFDSLSRWMYSCCGDPSLMPTYASTRPSGEKASTGEPQPDSR